MDTVWMQLFARILLHTTCQIPRARNTALQKFCSGDETLLSMMLTSFRDSFYRCYGKAKT